MRNNARLERLRRNGIMRRGKPCPEYISVPSMADLPAALAALDDGCSGVKLYVGISPDDWDVTYETQTTVA